MVTDSNERYEILREYFNRIASRTQPLFVQHGWKYCNKVPTTKDIVDNLFELEGIASQTGRAMSGRFLVIKDQTGNKVGVQVYFDICESSWEY